MLHRISSQYSPPAQSKRAPAFPRACGHGRRQGQAGGEGRAGLPPVPLKLRPHGCASFTNTFIYWCQHLASSHGEWPESIKKIRRLFPEERKMRKFQGGVECDPSAIFRLLEPKIAAASVSPISGIDADVLTCKYYSSINNFVPGPRPR
jgi:hypothetical protein